MSNALPSAYSIPLLHPARRMGHFEHSCARHMEVTSLDRVHHFVQVSRREALRPICRKQRRLKILWREVSVRAARISSGRQDLLAAATLVRKQKDPARWTRLLAG